MIEETKADLGLPVLSDAMVRRDNYFHNCWMLLKHTRPDLWETLTKIELETAGFQQPVQKHEGDDEPDDINIL